MSTILITGGLGHIGSKLIHSIKPREFNEVRIVDNLATQRYASLFNLPKKVNFRFFKKDILDESIFDITRDVDVVIHLAAITDAVSSFRNRDEVEKVNYKGTKIIVDACIENGSKLFFPSTTSVYGVQKDLVDEHCSSKNLKPQSPYAEYKLKSEQMIKSLSKNKNLKFVICRLGTIFGTSIGMRFHTAVNKFCWQAVMDKPLTIWSTALDQKRPYLGINDAIRAVRFILDKNLFNNKIYNVLSSNYTVGEIVDTIKKTCPNLNCQFVDSEIMNQLSYTVSKVLFEKEGFNFYDDIDSGINETIALLNHR